MDKSTELQKFGDYSTGIVADYLELNTPCCK